MTAEDHITRLLRGNADAISKQNDVEGSEQDFKRPPEGSEEEMMMMQALWQDPSFRESFYKEHGDKLEAMGYAKDGTFPAGDRIKGLGSFGKEEKKGIMIIPEPGFVLKTRSLETNEKVFINICRSSKVKGFKHEVSPEDPSETRVRIPLSLGPKRNDLDKNGEPCIVYDVVFNTQVIEQASQQKEFKDFLIGLALSWIMEKGGGGLDVEGRTFSKIRGNYKGKAPVPQMVRAEAMIEEIDEDGPIDAPTDSSTFRGHTSSQMPWPNKSVTRRAADNANYADAGTMSAPWGGQGAAKYAQYMQPGDEAKSGVETPQHRIYMDCHTVGGGVIKAWHDGQTDLPDNVEVRAMVVKFEMPRMTSANEAIVDVCEKLLAVEVPDKYEIELTLPHDVDDNAADAAFDRKKSVLTLTLPLKSWTSKVYAAARAKRANEGMENDDNATHASSHNEDNQTSGRDAIAVEGVSIAGESNSAGRNGIEAESQASGHKGVSSNKIKEEGDFQRKLRENLQKQSEKSRLASAAQPQPVLGSKEEAEMKEREKMGDMVSDRRPFECERCMWRSVATAVRSCKRCHWCEPGSKEEAKMIEEVKEQEKWRASRKQDEVGVVDETGGVEDESSIRAFRFRSRLAFELDVDEPSWLQGIREKHYNPGEVPKLSDFK